MTLEESAARYTNETEMQAEELMQSLTVVLDDGYGAKVGGQASRALLVKTLAVQREHERAVYKHHRSAYPGTSFTLQQRVQGKFFHGKHRPSISPRTDQYKIKPPSSLEAQIA